MSSDQKIYIPMDARPRCEVDGCDNPRQHMGSYRKDGSPIFRNLCQQHHNERVAQKYGLKNIAEVMAKKAGFDSVTEFLNSKHPYRQYRKSYCENIDGRLGHTCTTTIVWDGQLEVDHIDGDPSNNDEENLQTLCSCCHKYKSYINEDYRSPGRKALGITY